MIGRPHDASKLSTNPAQIRRRLRRGKGKFEEDLALYAKHNGRWKPIEEWDLQELAHGKPRSKNGDFRGRKPKWITDEVAHEAKRRLMDETFTQIAEHMTVALRCIVNLIKNEDVDDNGRPVVDSATKLKASIFIIEHILGKPKAVVEIEAADFTRKMLASAIVLDDGQPQDMPVILEGSIIEKDDDADGE